ncbi:MULTISPECIES: AraC family transcriptional regulator [Rhizobium]|uniref:Transcriptional regulator containing an amidase domain and an AraC-type DNA-binding HTH domain n=1 Tax=Rhizobium favelukesii TaxID=348824 RepID=W6RX40_9HYPH|nr:MULTISPECIES: AraC family transcriptional regulator [Rhizobium]MCS0458667.1 AraC family transcriptional regulator [Rhizobium favelukesii]UFS79560.1 AraC family transcriptional regulator [Rhizobium sp. T136]CDM63178.1 transcriptional regulator containing an amidase domain and an AraC-type DNA-binding HTH domain [Rhizobium favelukesii]
MRDVSEPDLEVVQIRSGESFKMWSHGYPYHTVRWHFHPEYEIHLITETSGCYFVGDFIGDFQPGNFVMTGPNLPHNWVSEVVDNRRIEQRCLVLQFSEAFIDGLLAILPELKGFRSVLADSRRGVLFSLEAAALAKPIMQEMLDATGARRIALFMRLVELLTGANDHVALTTSDYQPDPSGYMSIGTNKALAFIRERLTEPFSETDLSAIAGQTPSAFSRSFRKHTGFSVIQYVNRLRINLACQLLMSSEDTPVIDICYASGFNNLSNFNRHFLAQKGMPPSRFRALRAQNEKAVEAA